MRLRIHNAILRVVMPGVVLGVGAGGARAAPVTAYFEGVIDFVDPGLGLDGSVAPGTPFWGTYGYEPQGATDEFPDDPRVGFYDFGTSWTLAIHVGNYDFESNDLGVLIWDDTASGDAYQVANRTPFASGVVQWTNMFVRLQDPTGIAMNTDALPATLPDLENFATRMVGFSTVPHEGAMTGTLTSLVPEPGTLSLLWLAAFLVMKRRR